MVEDRLVRQGARAVRQRVRPGVRRREVLKTGHVTLLSPAKGRRPRPAARYSEDVASTCMGASRQPGSASPQGDDGDHFWWWLLLALCAFLLLLVPLVLALPS